MVVDVNYGCRTLSSTFLALQLCQCASFGDTSSNITNDPYQASRSRYVRGKSFKSARFFLSNFPDMPVYANFMRAGLQKIFNANCINPRVSSPRVCEL